MKKYVSFLISVLLLALTVLMYSCNGNTASPANSIDNTEESGEIYTDADLEDTDLEDITLDKYTLEDVKSLGFVVMENGDITCGEEIWKSFTEKTSNGTPASVRYAKYYTLGDKSTYSPEYYDRIIDDYPCMFAHNLSFDGEKYTDIHYENGKEYKASYKYMLKYEGTPLSSSATFSSYTYYVLVNDESITWADCEKALYSSDINDFIDFYTVYSDIVYKEQ